MRVWLGVSLMGLMLPQMAGAACAPDQVAFPAAGARFRIEIADTPAERATGLMNRKALAPDAGMLFVYDKPGHPFFWMKDTLIPLDMIFLAPDGRISRLYANALPLDETPIDGGAGVQYVLEIAGGRAADLGLTVGAAMVWPGLGPTAAQPCD